jgi:4-amino-4-deoxy-L-arabinose transferase-like glycosyltransferase
MPARWYWTFVALVLAVTLAWIANTHLTFAQTLDEPVHVGAGHEWLTKGRYHLDFQHPPLSRALFALPFLDAEPVHTTHPSEYGNDLYAKDDRYIHNVAASRRGNLLFVAIAALAVAASARRLFGPAAACVALVLFVSLPPVLAHGGLATTDMPAAAGFALAFHALLLWSEDPSWRRTMLLGAAVAFGAACKYSFVVFFPAAMVIVLIARRRLAIGRLLAAALVAFVLTWGLYGFTFRPIAESNPDALGIARAAGVPDAWSRLPVPAPDFLVGLVMVRFHNRLGHSAYLLGQTSESGWWYYFPIALAVKTPIPYLLLSAIGAFLLFRRRRPEAFLVIVAAAILLIAMSSRINIGVRHLLPIYVPLSLIAAYASVELWRARSAMRVALCGALAWLIVSSALAHPDSIPWMNALAGRHPQRVLLDSNFDWGQDIWRLARICRKRGIQSLEYAVVTNVRPSSIGITGGRPLQPHGATSGWIVISEENLQLARVKDRTAYAWLERHAKFERVGKTLRLYHVTEPAGGASTLPDRSR